MRCVPHPVLAALLTLSACYEGPDSTFVDAPESSSSTADEGDSTGSPLDPDESGCDSSVGPAVVRRLTRFEYDNTVRDLLGTAQRPAQAFAAEEELNGFDNNGAVRTVGELHAEQYMMAGEMLAAEAIADPAALLGCDVDVVGEDACVDAFVRRFARRAYRRPLADDDVEALLAVYAQGRGDGLAPALGLVVQTVLSSPWFLYRIEIGQGAPDEHGTIALRDVEIASRLSYFLWGSLPDDVLLADAETGELHEPEQIAAHAERLLEDPRAHATIADLHRQLMDLDALATTAKDPVAFPAWNDDVRDSMLEETQRFAADVVLVDDGRLATLLGGRYTFVDATLAAYYELGGVDAGDEPVRVELAPDQPRGGLLAHGALLAVLGKYGTTAPVQRGKFVRETLLCQPMPPPPDNVDFDPPSDDPDATMRERYAEHSANPSCAACHRLIDPIGFGFEAFDGAGRWRADEHGLPIDASGELVGTDVDGPFVGTAELADRLAMSRVAHDCWTTQMFRWALGRAETEADECTLERLRERFAEDGDVRALLVEITRTPAFRSVRPAEESP
ncbi:MAG TPA: DUF1592 domain-containing protein [Nannocystaceae bacterium]|nr:DUF1592 domain-containing protein [Nannocystaceae bacterium]